MKTFIFILIASVLNGFGKDAGTVFTKKAELHQVTVEVRVPSGPVDRRAAVMKVIITNRSSGLLTWGMSSDVYARGISVADSQGRRVDPPWELVSFMTSYSSVELEAGKSREYDFELGKMFLLPAGKYTAKMTIPTFGFRTSKTAFPISVADVPFEVTNFLNAKTAAIYREEDRTELRKAFDSAADSDFIANWAFPQTGRQSEKPAAPLRFAF